VNEGNEQLLAKGLSWPGRACWAPDDSSILFVKRVAQQEQLKHRYEGKELDISYLEKTLPYVYLLWGRPVHIETIIEAKEVIFSYDGKKNKRRLIES